MGLEGYQFGRESDAPGADLYVGRGAEGEGSQPELPKATV